METPITFSAKMLSRINIPALSAYTRRYLQYYIDPLNHDTLDLLDSLSFEIRSQLKMAKITLSAQEYQLCVTEIFNLIDAIVEKPLSIYKEAEIRTEEMRIHESAFALQIFLSENLIQANQLFPSGLDRYLNGDGQSILEIIRSQEKRWTAQKVAACLFSLRSAGFLDPVFFENTCTEAAKIAYNYFSPTAKVESFSELFREPFRDLKHNDANTDETYRALIKEFDVKIRNTGIAL